MFLIHRMLQGHRVRWVARPLAVALFAIAIGALPIAGSAVAEAGSSGDHRGGECEFSQGV